MQVNQIIEEDLARITGEDVPWEKLKGKSVLISGGNGFLPAYMIYTILYLNDTRQYGITVVALVRNKERAEKKFGSLLERPDFRLIVQDVSDRIIYNDDVHYIIHAASQASPKYYGIDPVGTLNANTLGTSNLLQLAVKNKVESFLFFSTSEVYGTVDPSKIPTAEKDYGYIDINNVRSCYAESKRLGETMCVSYLHQYNVPVKIVRPFHTYGPGMDLNDGRVYADFIADIHFNRNIEMKSDGSAMRAFCYLSDATAGFYSVLLKGQNGEPYNIGNEKAEISILGLAEKLVSLFPEKKLKVIRKETANNYLASTVSRNCPDSSKAHSLGWSATTSIEEGFFRTIKSYE